ncbi:MAG: alpha-L-rhamnosidase, partial [Kiritimatiellia bacterium]
MIEMYGIEYVEDAGESGQWIQHTANKQNGFRLICAEGENHWVSQDRRGMRYLLMMVRDASEPLRIRAVRMLESTYPAPAPAPFACSDMELERIRDVAIRTLKLCMEDTFTDCPTYEQVTWIGDARNEALYNYQVFGCRDIVRRTL